MLIKRVGATGVCEDKFLVLDPDTPQNSNHICSLSQRLFFFKYEHSFTTFCVIRLTNKQ